MRFLLEVLGKSVFRRASNTGVGNLRPACTFDMARIRIFVTQFRVQDCVKNKLHDIDKQLLRHRAVASGGKWCRAPHLKSVPPHFTFDLPVVAYIQYCILKM